MVTPLALLLGAYVIFAPAVHLYLIFYLFISFHLKGVSYDCLQFTAFSFCLFDLRNDRVTQLEPCSALLKELLL